MQLSGREVAKQQESEASDWPKPEVPLNQTQVFTQNIFQSGELSLRFIVKRCE